MKKLFLLVLMIFSWSVGVGQVEELMKEFKKELKVGMKGKPIDISYLDEGYYDIYFHDSISTYCITPSSKYEIQIDSAKKLNNSFKDYHTNYTVDNLKLTIDDSTYYSFEVVDNHIWSVTNFFKSNQKTVTISTNDIFMGEVNIGLPYKKTFGKSFALGIQQKNIDLTEPVELMNLLVFFSQNELFYSNHTKEEHDSDYSGKLPYINSDSASIVLKNIIIDSYHDNSLFWEIFDISKSIEIRNCKFNNEIGFPIRRYNFLNDFSILFSKTHDAFSQLQFENCTFEKKIMIESLVANSLSISDNTFNGEIFFRGIVFHGGEQIGLYGENSLDFSFKDNIINNSSKGDRYFTIELLITEDASLFMENNVFKSSNVGDYISIQANLKSLVLFNNSFDIPIRLDNSKVTEKLTINKNKLNKKGSFVFSDFLFPEQVLRVNLPWEQLEGRVKSLTVDTLDNYGYSNKIYSALTKEELSDKDSFIEFIKTYNFLYGYYLNIGNKESRNKVFAEMKDAEMRRLRYIYETEGGLKNWFKWWLAWLLKVYTEHGTDPAKALVISFYLMWGFAVFYFFFPSEWDKFSKPAIIQNFKHAISKEQKGIFRPLMKAIGYMLLSFFNALTLSLNAFVTLGFGNIPTKGIARYVCILQGFMGWFLLSIFSVALINQVLG